MHSGPHLLVLAVDGSCVLLEALRGASGPREGLVAKILGIKRSSGDLIECWLEVVGGGRRRASRLAKELKRLGASCKVSSLPPAGFLVQMCYNLSSCPMGERCVLLNPPSGVMVSSALMTPQKIVVTAIAASKKAIRGVERMGYRLLSVRPLSSANLTYNQFKLLLQAYMSGYYSFPRKISLKDLAKKLNVSVSGLAESLRKAEQKIIINYILREGLLYLYNNSAYNVHGEDQRG